MADEGSVTAAPPLHASSELCDAAAKGDVDRVQELLAAGADVAQVDEEQSMTPLMLAARHGHADVVRALLQAGAPWNALNPSGLCAGKEEVTVSVSVLLRFLIQPTILSVNLWFYYSRTQLERKFGKRT